MTRQSTPPGYTLGRKEVPHAEISAKELRALETIAAFEDADRDHLRASKALLEPHLDAVVHAWMDFLLDHDPLNAAFRGADGEILPDYVDAVRARLKAWIRDTAEARHDQEWLDYQFEIGRRLHRTKKNRTDGAEAAAVVAFRHLIPALVPFITCLRPYLEQGEAAPDEVERMLTAWTKSLTIQMSLWAHAYVPDDDF